MEALFSPQRCSADWHTHPHDDAALTDSIRHTFLCTLPSLALHLSHTISDCFVCFCSLTQLFLNMCPCAVTQPASLWTLKSCLCSSPHRRAYFYLGKDLPGFLRDLPPGTALLRTLSEGYPSESIPGPHHLSQYFSVLKFYFFPS